MSALSSSADTEPHHIPARRSGAVRFIVAVTGSAYGDWLTTVGLVVLVYQLGGAAAAAGYILVRSTPRVAGPLIGGSLADRFAPHRVLALASALQAVLTLAVILAVGARTLWGIYAGVAAIQLLGGAARTCFGAIIPTLTSPERLGRLNAVYTGLYTTSIFVGPAAGALLLAHGGVQVILAIDAVSFALCAVIVATLRTSPRHAGPSAAEGPRLSLVLRDPMLRSLVVAYSASGLLVTAVQAVLVVAAADRFGGASDVGFLYAGVGAGGLLGSAALLLWRPGTIGRRAVVLCSVLELAPLIVLTEVAALPLAAVLVGLSSFGGTLYQVRGSAALQSRMQGAFLGRANGVVFAASYFGMLVGGVLALLLTPALGWQRTVLVAAAVAFVALLGAAGRTDATT